MSLNLELTKNRIWIVNSPKTESESKSTLKINKFESKIHKKWSMNRKLTQIHVDYSKSSMNENLIKNRVWIKISHKTTQSPNEYFTQNQIRSEHYPKFSMNKNLIKNRVLTINSLKISETHERERKHEIWVYQSLNRNLTQIKFESKSSLKNKSISKTNFKIKYKP